MIVSEKWLEKCPKLTEPKSFDVCNKMQIPETNSDFVV